MFITGQDITIDGFQGWDMVENPLDTIEFRTVVEINSRVLGLMNGDFHGTDGYLPQDQVKRLAASENVVVDEQESMRIFYSIIHNGRSPMNDVNFRKGAVVRLRLRRVHRQHPVRLRRPRPGAAPEQHVGRADGRRGLHL